MSGRAISLFGICHHTQRAPPWGLCERLEPGQISFALRRVDSEGLQRCLPFQCLSSPSKAGGPCLWAWGAGHSVAGKFPGLDLEHEVGAAASSLLGVAPGLAGKDCGLCSTL